MYRIGHKKYDRCIAWDFLMSGITRHIKSKKNEILNMAFNNQCDFIYKIAKTGNELVLRLQTQC